MRWNCVHTFTLEAESEAGFYEKLARYSDLVKRASDRLDIGYSHALVTGRVAADMHVKLRAIADQEPETLFDG